MLGMKSLELDEINNVMVIRTNNGLVRFEDIIGIDPQTGEDVPTLIDKSMEMQQQNAEAKGTGSGAKDDLHKKADSLTAGSTGLGGDLKKQIEGKN